jgi:hypothetical protein
MTNGIKRFSGKRSQLADPAAADSPEQGHGIVNLGVGQSQEFLICPIYLTEPQTVNMIQVFRRTTVLLGDYRPEMQAVLPCLPGFENGFLA